MRPRNSQWYRQAAGLLAGGAILALGGGAAAAVPFGVVEGLWQDAVRERGVPYRVYAPQVDRPVPLVVFSHGFGGSRAGGDYLGRCLAERGWLFVAVEHEGSNRAALGPDPSNPDRERIARAMADPRTARDRYDDIPFALNRLLAEDWRVDPSRMALAGHSFGAITALRVAGVEVAGEPSHRDPRFGAFVVLSGSSPRENSEEVDFGGVTDPVLHVTGTLDRITRFGLMPDLAIRKSPFAATVHSDRHWVVLEGADHLVFASALLPRRLTPPELDIRLKGAACRLISAFLTQTLPNPDAAGLAEPFFSLVADLEREGLVAEYAHELAR